MEGLEALIAGSAGAAASAVRAGRPRRCALWSLAAKRLGLTLRQGFAWFNPVPGF